MTTDNTLAARLREAERHYRLGFQLGDLLSEAAAALESVEPQEDADEREAHGLYLAAGYGWNFANRHQSGTYRHFLAALKRGRELEQGK